MATYIKGVEDYVPSLEPFRPDYKFLSNVLSVRQDRYDTNFKQLNNLYNDVLNAPLSKQQNIERRDQFANRLSNGLKQISGMDLSLQQNAEAAKGLFKPFFEDKDILFDMAYTKRYQKGMQDAQFFATSPREKDQNRYWQYGVSKLNIDMDQFKNASMEDARKMSLPEYVENPNILERAFDALKESGLSATQTTVDGNWIIKTKNGTALTDRIIGYQIDDKKFLEDGTTPNPNYGKPLLGEDGKPKVRTTNTGLNWLAETLLRDPVIQRGLAVQAYVTAHNFYTNPENIEKYGGTDGAKKAWAEQYIVKTSNEDKKNIAENTTAVKSSKTVLERWNDYKIKHGIVPGSPEDEIMLQKMFEMQILQETADMSTTRVKKLSGPAPNIDLLLDKGYQGYIKSIAGPLLKEAAATHSQVGAEVSYEANDFKLNEQKHIYDLQLQHEKNLDAIDILYRQGEIDAALQEDLYNRKAQLEAYKSMLEGKDTKDVDFGEPPSIKPPQFTFQDATEEGSTALMTNINRDSQRWAEGKIREKEVSLMKMMLESFPNSFVNNDMIKENGGVIAYRYKSCSTCAEEYKEADWQTAIADLTRIDDATGMIINSAEYKRLKSTLVDIPLSSLATKVEGTKYNKVLMYTDIPELNTEEGREREQAILTTHAQLMQMRNLYVDLVGQKNKGYENLWKFAVQTPETGLEEAMFRNMVPGVLSHRQIEMIQDGVPMNLVYNAHNLDLDRYKEVLSKEQMNKYKKLSNDNKIIPSKALYQKLVVSALKNNYNLGFSQLGLQPGSGIGIGYDEIYKYLNANFQGPEYVNGTGWYSPTDENYAIQLFELFPELRKYWQWDAESTFGNIGSHLGGSSQGEWKFRDDLAIKDANMHYDGSEESKPNTDLEDEGMFQTLNKMLIDSNASLRGYDVNFMAGWVGQKMLTREGPGAGRIGYPSYGFHFDYLDQDRYTKDQLNHLKGIFDSGIKGTDFIVAYGDARGGSVEGIMDDNSTFSIRDDSKQDLILRAILNDYVREYDWDKGDHPIFDIEYRQKGSEEGWASYRITLDKNYATHGQWETLLGAFAETGNMMTTDTEQVKKQVSDLLSKGITVFVNSSVDDNPYHTKNRAVDPIASEIKRTNRPFQYTVPNGGIIQVEASDIPGMYIIKSNKTKWDGTSINTTGWITEQGYFDDWGLTDILFRGIDDLQNNAKYQINLRDNPSQ